MAEPDPVYCSFCGKSNRETDVMLAGPVRTFICAECIRDASMQVEQKRRDDVYMRDVVRCAFCRPVPIEGESRAR
ncbi:ClpX C4-type zinc finger protein [Nitrobacter winogradskyi]|uniref:ClpX-type ZB domain-containing protein n=2 Tax=Nitrobacter winogradskyi TaxID=913 RepID=A0A4Y3W8F4_NITWI|nr:ClpX C4-type zinc finger protein [Nitrobacter winogradskyi]MCP1998798.1 ATP-dependent protease Clp ATPase subunit [Nitrobacter winogradskyi]GEC14280.1 hypothetical protein NWI01_01720 [Nitrobacter winogradskyi]